MIDVQMPASNVETVRFDTLDYGHLFLFDDELYIVQDDIKGYVRNSEFSSQFLVNAMCLENGCSATFLNEELVIPVYGKLSLEYVKA